MAVNSPLLFRVITLIQEESLTSYPHKVVLDSHPFSHDIDQTDSYLKLLTKRMTKKDYSHSISTVSQKESSQKSSQDDVDTQQTLNNTWATK